MGLADRLKKNEERKSRENSTEEALRNTFNESTTKLINQFMADVNSGSIKIEDVGDLTRLFQIYLQVNNIDNMAEGNNGTFPELSSGQREIFEKHVAVGKEEDEEGEEEETISLTDLESADDSTIDKMLQERELEMNKENEGSF